MNKEKLYIDFLKEQMGFGDLSNYSNVKEFKKDDPIGYEIGLREFNT